jgi:Family of unknown function (DUF5519)
VAGDDGQRLIDEVSAWEGVDVGEGRFGSVRFSVGRRELGHIHGTTALDVPLPPTQKAELIERGEAIPHRFTPPGSGWVTIMLESTEAVDRALEILRERYEHAQAVNARREPA